MILSSSNIAKQVAKAVSAFQLEQTGHAPKSVTVVLSENTIVITLHGALTQAEQAMATNPLGAAKVQEFHRQLFLSSSERLRQEIKRITGVDVQDSTVEVETATGTVVHAFTNGTMVQVYLMTDKVPTESWSGN